MSNIKCQALKWKIKFMMKMKKFLPSRSTILQTYYASCNIFGPV